MENERKGSYRQKHGPDQKVNTKASLAVKKHASNAEIPCAVAFKIAAELGIPPLEVGIAADFLEIRVTKCQLGLYGYRPNKKIVTPAETVSQTLEETIRRHLVNGRLPCKAAWKIAKKLKISKLAVSSACEALRVRITSCQLGSF